MPRSETPYLPPTLSIPWTSGIHRILKYPPVCFFPLTLRHTTSETISSRPWLRVYREVGSDTPSYEKSRDILRLNRPFLKFCTTFHSVSVTTHTHTKKIKNQGFVLYVDDHWGNVSMTPISLHYDLETRIVYRVTKEVVHTVPYQGLVCVLVSLWNLPILRKRLGKEFYHSKDLRPRPRTIYIFHWHVKGYLVVISVDSSTTRLGGWPRTKIKMLKL